MKSSRQGSVTLRPSPTSSSRHPQGSTTNSSPQKHSPFKSEKAPCLSRGNSPSLKMPVNKKKGLPLHRETKKPGPYIFDPDTVESISTENINPFPSTRLSEKDLDARLQLGELKLSCLDNRITQCLENSRKVLSVTEAFCRQTADVIASERIIPANSELILSYSKSKNKSDEEIIEQSQVDVKQEALKKEEQPNQVKNINISDEKQTEGKLARSKSCSIVVPQELAIDIIKDKLENFAQKGFLSTKNKRQEKITNLKQKDVSFKDLMNTISPSLRKVKLLMPFEYEKFEEKVNSLQTIGLLSPKEFDIQSMASIKEEAGKEDINKLLKQNGQMTNSSNLEDLRDFLSLLHNIDAKTGKHSDTYNLSSFDLKESTHRQLNDQKGNNNILQIDEIQLEEDKETRNSLENKNSLPTQEQVQKKIEPSNSEKAIKLLALKQEESINHLLVTPETYTPREIKPKSPGQPRFEMGTPKTMPRVRTSPRKIASSRKEIPRTQENSKSKTTRDKIKSPVRHSSDSRSPQKTREQSKDTETPSRGNSRSAREKNSTKPEKKNPKEETQRESPDEATKNLMKRKKEAIQNLITKFVKDAERRKESLERARAAKEEKEKQTLSLMNQVFTNKNNKSESKVRQYICRNRGRIESINGSETQRAEKTSFMQEKRTKKVSFSIEKSPSRVIQREASNNISQQKSTREPIASAIAKDLKEIEKVCMKENKELDLDYLRGLRSDIEKIKENIEEKIQGIEKANAVRGLGEKHVTKSILKKTEIGMAKGSKSTNHSLERLNERSQKGRVKTRFQNSSSRILEYIGAKTEKASSSRIEPNKLFEPASINSLNLNQLTRTSSSAKNLRSKDQLTPRKWFNHEKPASQTKSTFMDDVRAMNYVNQLISDFKDIQGLKSPRKK